ncbi:hypothetical protein C5Z25_11080 [Lactobacillus sp. CBA3605]|uniref:TetR/AcrR family transcriptional regulator n=1 Tax=Lactobacillus sp. CBA3605 TaxID=2099788 RepID=UPI000CFB4F65|nr:TetR/AcrR family transcriptional regulator [Lactobacillus sp. CBA3605]AVK62283.1 hypothetical protein C5Z25_11080 [Lactobacillus sp. CBA3605]
MKVKDNQKYDRLIQAAIQVLATDGLARFSTTKVAKLAKIPQSNLYIYFKNKQSLLNATYQVAVHQMSVAVVANFTPSMPLLDQISASITGLYHFALVQPAAVTAIQLLIDDVHFKQQAQLKQTDSENQQIQTLLRQGVDQQLLQPVALNLLRYFLTRPVFHYAEGIRAGQYAETPATLAALTTMVMGAILRPTVYLDWLQTQK